MSHHHGAVSPPEPARPEFSLGGQALIEGVMMRSPHFIAAAVRRADGGIETRVEKFDSVAATNILLRLPLVRGVVALIEMMAVGMRYLNWSAGFALHGSAPENEQAPAAAAGSDSAPATLHTKTGHANPTGPTTVAGVAQGTLPPR